MRILVVHAHPVAESFSTALFRTVCETLSLRGHEVRPMDLYAIGFDPVMSRAERIAYHDRGTNAAPVADQAGKADLRGKGSNYPPSSGGSGKWVALAVVAVLVAVGAWFVLR